VRRPPFFFIDDRLDDFDVHGVVANPRHFGGYARPMQETLSVTGKARPCRQPLRVIVGGAWVPSEQQSGVFVAEPPQRSSSFQPV